MKVLRKFKIKDVAVLGGTRIFMHVLAIKMIIRDPQLTSAGFLIFSYTRNFSSRDRVTMSTGQRVFIKSLWYTRLGADWKKDCPIYSFLILPLLVYTVCAEKNGVILTLCTVTRSLLLSNCFQEESNIGPSIDRADVQVLMILKSCLGRRKHKR